MQHELFHVMGLYHAGALSSSNVIADYGDQTSLMGSGSCDVGINAYEAWRLQFLIPKVYSLEAATTFLSAIEFNSMDITNQDAALALYSSSRNLVFISYRIVRNTGTDIKILGPNNRLETSRPRLFVHHGFPEPIHPSNSAMPVGSVCVAVIDPSVVRSDTVMWIGDKDRLSSNSRAGALFGMRILTTDADRGTASVQLFSPN